MPTPRLYSYWRSSCSWRVRLGLALKGIDYEYVAVNLLQKEQRGEANRARNPLAQVPTFEFEAGGTTQQLTQSLAILRYLDSLEGTPLMPADPIHAAKAWELAEIINAGIQPLQNLAVLLEIEALGGDRLAWGKKVITDGFVALEARAKATAGTYLVGDTITIADLCLVPQMYNARRFGVDLAPFETLVRIDAALSEVEVLKAAHPDQQPDAA